MTASHICVRVSVQRQHMHICMCNLYICMYAWRYVGRSVYMYTDMRVCIFVCIYYIYTCKRVYLYIYIYIHTYTHINTRRQILIDSHTCTPLAHQCTQTTKTFSSSYSNHFLEQSTAKPATCSTFSHRACKAVTPKSQNHNRNQTLGNIR